MPRVPLLGGAYQSRAIISSSQRCINLYPEKNEDEQAPAPVTHFPTPGLVRRGTPPVEGVGRCTYRASNGEVFVVVAGNIYFVSQFFAYTLIGTIPSLDTPVIMADNGLAIVLTDGTPTAYTINIQLPPAAPPPAAYHAFGTIADTVFISFAALGVSHCAYIDGYFVFNSMNSLEWFISLTTVTFGNLRGIDPHFISPLFKAFDSQDRVSKIGSADPIAGIITMHKNIWIVGTLTGEVWYNSGAADFTFQAVGGVFSERGCIAPYSIAAENNSIYWLSRSRQGRTIVLRWGADFQVDQISPPGIDAIFGKLAVTSDAIGGCYQLLGHTYYIITFPTAGRSFACETESKEWHELAWTSPNGLERHRSQGWCHGYDMVLTIDRDNGRLYQLDPFTLTDDGGPITRLRTIPHILNDGKRVRLDRVIADTQGGTLGGTVSGPYSQSIQEIITDLGLPAPKLLLEAGSLSSWPGTGQKWLDESGNGYDFFRGVNGVIVGSDPVYVGVPGGQSLSEYWNFSGTQFFTYDAATEPWMDALHQNNAKGSGVFMVYIPPDILPMTASRIVALYGDFSNNQTTAVGSEFVFYLDRPLFVVCNNGVIYQFQHTTASLTQAGWHVVAFSIDEAANTASLMLDGVIRTAPCTYVNPSAATASQTFQIGAYGNNAAPLPSGCRMSFAAMWQGDALTPPQLTSLHNAISANNLLPSPRFATPQIFLRISYDRGGSFQDALPASMGNEGEYGELPWWPNLGMGRDIVLELSWSAPTDTALNGVFIEATPVGT